ncbi:MAG: family 1 extracellular solute-binding protein [Rhodoglobus sp.]|nr:family 1 extracellular solute-binding protein [Rhodoglobus sp.]
MPSTTRVRRAVALATALVVAATLAACSSGGGSDQAGCHLSFMASADRPTAEQDAYKEVFADFEKAYNCTVDTTFEGTWDQITQQLTAARLASQQVNLFVSGTASRDLAKAGLSMDLTQCIAPFKDRFLDSALAPYTVDNHNWAIPMSSTDTSAIFYNADMFAQLGIQPPTTFQELVDAGDKISAAQGIVPIIHQGKSPWYWPMWYMSTFAQTSGNKSIQYTEDFLSGKRQFDSPEEVQALNDLAKFTQDGLLDQTTLDTDEQGMFASFLQGKAAMFYGLTPSLINLEQGNPTFKIGVFQFPKVVSDASVAPQVGGGPENGISIASFAPEATKVMSCQLLEFMSRPDEAKKILDPGNPLVPSVKSVPATANEPLAPQLTSEFIPNTITFLDWIWPSQVNDAVTSAITDVMYNGKSGDDAAKSVQAALDKLVAEEDYKFDWWTAWTNDDWAKVSFPSDMKIDVTS